MSNVDLLHANASSLEATGNEFVSCGEQYSQIMSSMRNRVEGLRGDFQGSGAESFYNKMQEILTRIQTLSNEVTEMGNDLKTTAARAICRPRLRVFWAQVRPSRLQQPVRLQYARPPTFPGWWVR